MKYIDDMDKNIESAVKKMVKGKKSVKKSTASEEPKDAAGWLRKAYVDNDPSDGAPKVGDIGYV